MKSSAALAHVLEHGRRKSRIDADKERVAHQPIGIGQIAHDAVLNPRERGLPQQVAGKKLPRLNLTAFQEPNQVDPSERLARGER